MNSQESQNTNTEQLLEHQHFTLLDLLDRLLDKGAMVKGEILLSVADIELVYLNLGLLLSSVKTVESAARRGGQGEAEQLSRQPSSQQESFDERLLRKEGKEAFPAPLPEEKGQVRDGERKEETSAPFSQEEKRSGNDAEETVVRALPSADEPVTAKPRANIDPKNVEKGLAKLVLTLVDLIRKLMERQAIRRVEDDQLSSDEIEKMGNAFLLLEEKMEELKETFCLTDEDLNVDLGPLGDLL
jgi:gas vesicle protein GvpK/gas vesicle protein GvpA/GvpJ/GvpM family